MNSIYLGDRALDPPEDVVMVNCTYCHKSAYSLEWRKNRGHCPLCHKAYAGPGIEDDLLDIATRAINKPEEAKS